MRDRLSPEQQGTGKLKVVAPTVKWRRSHFGLWADYEHPECDVVVVCVMGGSHYELHPIALRLPHQIYKDECERWLKEHNAKEIVVIPAESKRYLTIIESRKP